MPSHLALKDTDGDVHAKRMTGVANLLTKKIETDCNELPPFPAMDPRWRILIEMYKSRSAAAYASVSFIATAAEIPDTTSLRLQKALHDDGLIKRCADPADKRRIWVSLTPKGVAIVEAALAGFAEALDRSNL